MKASERDSLLIQILALLPREDRSAMRYELVRLAESLVTDYRILSFNGIAASISRTQEAKHE